MNIKPVHVFLVLCGLFLLYSVSIYSKPYKIEPVEGLNQTGAAEGRLIWQKYNCQNCHQFYGLGGHLGPDLTNEYSRLDGNTKALRIYLNGGIKQMPRLELSDHEKEVLIEFLKITDASGSADPFTYKRLSNGMIEQGDGR